MIKGKIFLSGGGNQEQSFEFDRKFFDLLGNNSKILYIPVALERETIGFEACWDWFSNLISTHTDNKDIDFNMLLEGDPIINLDKYNAIYIGGGNTYKLLNFINNNGLKDKILRSSLQEVFNKTISE